jgi:hypothetical protein
MALITFWRKIRFSVALTHWRAGVKNDEKPGGLTVHIASLELHENMELARTPSIPQSGAQRTPRVGCRRSGNLQRTWHSGTNSASCSAL